MVATLQDVPPEIVAANLAAIRQRIADAAEAAGRAAAEVQLVAVSKTFGPGAVRAALDCGQRVFGENRVQEAQAKYPELRASHPDLELHLIGPLQTNKVRDAVALFDVIQSVDRPKLAAALAAEVARSGRRIRCFIQVNIGEEPQKAGVAPEAADAFIAEARERHGLAVEGLMCIPPAGGDPAPHFALLREIARRNNLAGLSMGMSGDFETAIRLGATHVRVGTAIFGARPAAPRLVWARPALGELAYPFASRPTRKNGGRWGRDRATVREAPFPETHSACRKASP